MVPVRTWTIFCKVESFTFALKHVLLYVSKLMQLMCPFVIQLRYFSTLFAVVAVTVDEGAEKKVVCVLERGESFGVSIFQNFLII